ncbi:MAG: GMP synthase [Pseudomonadota bacterium]
MRVGILRTDTVRPDFAEHFGQYPQMFHRLLGEVDPSLEFRDYDVEHGEYPDEIDEVDAYLITGSKFSAYDDLPWIKQLIAFVQELHAARKKLVGICFGHQLVAIALGGAVEKSERGWGVGIHSATFTSLPPWHDGGEAQFRILVSHQDQVVSLGDGMEVLAGSDFCPVAVTQVDEHILTFQGHPEFETGYSRALIELRGESVGAQTYRCGLESLATMPEGPRVAAWIVRFLRGQ